MTNLLAPDEPSPAMQSLVKQAGQAVDIQEALLLDVLKKQASTAFGRKHDFGTIESFEDFQRRLPVSSYQDFAPWIERMVQGEDDVLFSGSVYKFVSSSGSVASPKIVPLSRDYVENTYKVFFGRVREGAIGASSALRLHWNKALNLKWDPGRTVNRLANGEAHLGLSQINFSRDFGDAGLLEPGAASPWSGIPSSIKGDLSRLYAKLLIAARYEIHAVIGINPRHVANLPHFLNEHRHQLIHDLRYGRTLGEIELEPLPEKANTLQSIVDGRGALFPRDVWPDIESIMCWDGSVAALYLDHVLGYYGDNPLILSAPLALSEAVLAVPFRNKDSAQILNFDTTVFEFRPMDAPSGPLLRLQDVKLGECYGIVVTTVSGFYRYDTGDLIEVVGFEQGVPLVKYTGRSNTPSVAGLNEFDGMTLLRRLKEESPEALACCFIDTSTSSGALRVFYECVNGKAVSASLAGELDRELMGRSQHYATARRNGLECLQLVSVAPGSFYDDWKRSIELGHRPQQVKDKVFRAFDDVCFETVS